MKSCLGSQGILVFFNLEFTGSTLTEGNSGPRCNLVLDYQYRTLQYYRLSSGLILRKELFGSIRVNDTTKQKLDVSKETRVWTVSPTTINIPKVKFLFRVSDRLFSKSGM